jgi:hypothetical protein
MRRIKEIPTVDAVMLVVMMVARRNSRPPRDRDNG